MMSSYKSPSAFTKMKDPKMDCPNKNCPGWLALYGSTDLPSPRPTYFQCSHKCNQPTIFSKKESKCPICKDPIKMREVITPGWDRQWIHYQCASLSTPPPDVFAVCLRCSENITSTEDSIPSSFNGIEGFLHISCTKKRQRSAAETDNE